MKKIFLFIAILAMPILNAQNTVDALRYSQQEVLGSARFRGMSGAFGAVGGDISSIHINPAGSALFLNSYGSFTLSNSDIYNEALYGNTLTSLSSQNSNFNQLGAVFLYKSDHPSKYNVNKLALGFTYEQTTDNADELLSFGRSTSSIDSFFLNQAQGVPLGLIARQSGESIDGLYGFLGETEGYSVQQAFLGYESFIIDAVNPDDLNNTSYTSNVSAGNFDQEYYYRNTGINGKFTLNLGAQINQDMYLGINLNSHFINFDRVTDFFESNSNTSSTINEILFTESLSTFGFGVSAEIGGIARLSRMIRLGASLETPTWYTINEETTQGLETFSNTEGTAIVNLNIINVFPEYQLKTPLKATGSIAFMFEQNGLISLDYTYTDYPSIRFSSEEGIDFSDQNENIQNNLKGAATIRLGTEWNYNNWSIRGGYSFEESPYTNEEIFDHISSLSLGTGWSFGKYRFDMAYTTTLQERIEQFYPNASLANSAEVLSITDSLTFTLGMHF